MYQLLGGAHRDKVEAYATGLFFKSRDFKQIVESGLEEVERYVKAGFTKIKMKIGLGIERDLERIGIIQKAVGASANLMVDANNCYDFHSALRLGRELEKRGILFFEAPIAMTDIEGHRALAEALDLPVADGETLSTVAGSTMHSSSAGPLTSCSPISASAEG